MLSWYISKYNNCSFHCLSGALFLCPGNVILWGKHLDSLWPDLMVGIIPNTSRKKTFSGIESMYQKYLQLKQFSGNKPQMLTQNGPKTCIFRNFKTLYLGSTMCLLGCVIATYCCAESVQNHDWTPSAHYFDPKGFTKWKIIKKF